MATTPLGSGLSPETRASYDGHLWSGPNYARDSAGVPIEAQGGVPPGIGTNYEKYLLAFFSANGTLHTQESTNGLIWSNDLTHGVFAVDQHSRPSVSFDRKSSRWYVAFRRSDGSVFVHSFSATSGQATSGNEVPDVRTIQAIGFAVSDLNVPAGSPHNRLMLAWRDGAGPIRMKHTLDPENWPAGSGIDTGIGSESGPFVDTAFGLVRLGVTGASVPPPGEDPFRFGEGPGRLAHGTVSVIAAKDDTFMAWERTFWVDGGTTSAGFSPAFAGPRTATVAAKGNYPLSTTSAWFSAGNVQRVSGLPPRAEPATRTGLDVSMAFGQEGNANDLLNVTLVFRRFHRGVPDRRQQEDVALEVEHFGGQRILGDDSTRPFLGRMNRWDVANAQKDATVQFTQGHGSQLPRFRALLQPGDQVRVKMSGDDGTVSHALTFDEVKAAFRTRGDSQLTANEPANHVSYTVFFIAESN